MRRFVKLNGLRNSSFVGCETFAFDATAIETKPGRSKKGVHHRNSNECVLGPPIGVNGRRNVPKNLRIVHLAPSSNGAITVSVNRNGAPFAAPLTGVAKVLNLVAIGPVLHLGHSNYGSLQKNDVRLSRTRG